MVSGSCGSSLTASICSTNLAIRRIISSLLMDIIPVGVYPNGDLYFCVPSLYPSGLKRMNTTFLKPIASYIAIIRFCSQM